jgi:NhaA family Na+:H+ antiporter
MTRAIRFLLDHSLAVPIGALLALVWANGLPESYFRFATTQAFWINDIGMAFFFAFAMQEVIETMVPGGALGTWRRATLPVVAAIGGSLGAVAAFEISVHRTDELILTAGWPIVCAVDAGFGYFLVKGVVKRRSAMVFLLLLTIASNAIGLIVVGLRQPVMATQPASVWLIVAAMAVSVGLAYVPALKTRVRSFWPHLLIAGTLSWFGFAWSGLHPALALLPIVPFFPHAPRDLNLLTDAPHSPHDSPRHFEHVFRVPVQIVLFLFALVNAGVLVRSYGMGTWAVLWGALAGRPIGILVSVGLAVAAGLHLPSDLGWRELIVVACAASVGFVFALFYATATFAVGPVLNELKTGALLTIAGGVIAVAVARLLRVGRFA